MADINGPVTRKEFYAALIVVWLAIAIAFGNLEPKSGTLHPWMTYVYWGISLAVSLAYAVLVLRGRRPAKGKDMSS